MKREELSMSILIKGMDKETAVRICAYAGVRMDDSDFVPSRLMADS